MPSVNFNRIDKIRVKGYKSIVDEAIELRPLTILAGANSSGKSSIMQPLLLLKQTLEEKNSAIPLFLPGENVSLTQYEQIRPKFWSATEKNEFEIGVQNKFLQATSTFYFDNKAQRVDISKTEFDFTPYAEQSKHEKFRGVNFCFCKDMSRSAIQNIVNKHEDKFRGFDRKKTYKVKEESCFLAIKPEKPSNKGAVFQDNQDDAIRFAGVFDYDLQGIIHLPGLRGDPSKRTFLRRPITPLQANDETTYFFKGKFPDYTASLIETWEKEGNGRFELLEKYVKNLRLATTVSTRREKESFLEIVVGWHPTEEPKAEGEMVNIADVGCGVSQVLPILTALVAAKESQIVYIEQPAIHLHPKAAVALASVIADAARRGVMVVIETHCALLLLAIQTIISQLTSDDNLKPKDVALYWFEKIKNPADGIVGATKISRGGMDENGAYGAWPVDFGRITMELQTQFMDAFEAKERSIK
jgi:predicted ATPase